MARGRILAIKWGLNPNSSSLGIDVTFLLVSQAPLAKLQAYKRRMGWQIPWVSAANTAVAEACSLAFSLL